MWSVKSLNVNEAKVAHNSHFNKFSWTNRKTVRARVARSLVALALTNTSHAVMYFIHQVKS